ncbi:MAG: hypothetical protein HYY28_09390 [Betaproteobacteria bacterium]|nr:hypothetical protein [Betaproteobacteria bacterium]MBI2960514.1 hypothetical protein [Betaproteobacteria bacterium]
MRWAKAAIVMATILVGTVAIGSTPAWAHRGGGRVNFGFVIGGPIWWGPAFYPPYYYYPPYYPPVAVVPSSPPTYIEQGSEAQAPSRSSSAWFYCADAKAYYPYVKECPGGWQRVAPQPPGN